MALFEFDRNAANVAVDFDLPGSMTRFVQSAPTGAAPGALHLYEHLVIRGNRVPMEQLRRQGQVHNAVTTAADVSFYFIGPDEVEVLPPRRSSAANSRLTTSPLNSGPSSRNAA